MRNRNCAFFLLNLLLVFAFTACTDYEELLEDDYGYLLIGTEEPWVEESSSDVIASSSGATQSSSSIVDAVCYGEYGAEYTCVTTKYLNQDMLDTNGYGEFVDTRDNQVYKTVTIGSGASAQTWMAQNLNYKTSDSYCYDDLSSSCDEYGRLYTWEVAVDACPSGWHLPSSDEWQTLYENVGGTSTAGTKLKSGSGWNSGGNGDDAYGFAVLPAGYRSSNGNFYNVGSRAYFWSSTEDYGSYAYVVNFDYDYSDVHESYGSKINALSVRCLRDSNGDVASSSSEEESSSSNVIASSSSAKQSSSSSSSVVASSSSNVIASSSSAKQSSSSIVYGTLTDTRDGQSYKTVTIGTQTWMAQNLNYSSTNSYCYYDMTNYCDSYGRLYTWNAAIEACPNGWILPSASDWNNLFASVGGVDIAGSALKSTSGWWNNANGGGSDDYGLSIFPAGMRYDDGHYDDFGGYAHMWSSTEYDQYYAYYLGFYYNYESVDQGGNNVKDFAFSVRCLRDDASSSSSAMSSSATTEDPESSSSIADAVCYGEYGAEYTCVTTKYLNQDMLDTNGYGEFVDTRDNQVYKTVTIGDQTWMAQNLNYAPENVSNYGSYAWSGCYNNSADSCVKYGHLYTWEVAMDKTACGYGFDCNNSYEGMQGICPAGWHLPSEAEWNTLFVDFGVSDIAGTMLKSGSGWNGDGNGNDCYGFAVLPAGDRNYDRFFYSAGNYAYFWSSTENGLGYAYSKFFGYGFSSVHEDAEAKYNAFSVRCLRN